MNRFTAAWEGNDRIGFYETYPCGSEEPIYFHAWCGTGMGADHTAQEAEHRAKCESCRATHETDAKAWHEALRYRKPAEARAGESYDLEGTDAL